MESDRKDRSFEKRQPYSATTDGARAIATLEHAAIRRWAVRHQAEPATGEATPSGPATVHVADGGTGLRFNFPGFGRFRPISWDEWLEHFEAHRLLFVYEEEVPDRAYELSKSREGSEGHDRDDWFEAERQLGAPATRPIGRYRIVKRDD